MCPPKEDAAVELKSFSLLNATAAASTALQRPACRLLTAAGCCSGSGSVVMETPGVSVRPSSSLDTRVSPAMRPRGRLRRRETSLDCPGSRLLMAGLMSNSSQTINIPAPISNFKTTPKRFLPSPIGSLKAERCGQWANHLSCHAILDSTWDWTSAPPMSGSLLCGAGVGGVSFFIRILFPVPVTPRLCAPASPGLGTRPWPTGCRGET